jgi:hypothetical protein
MIVVAMVLLVSVPMLAIRGGLLRRLGPAGEGATASFQLDLKDQLTVDPALIHHEEFGRVALSLDRPRAIACGLQDRLYVAGDGEVLVFSASLDQESVIPLDAQPACLTVGGAQHAFPGRLYVVTPNGVVVFDDQRRLVTTWPLPAAQTLATSIAVSDQEVLLADARSRVVWRFDVNGTPLGEIGRPDSTRDVPGFVVPSPHFDIAVDASELIHVVNPGKLQVTTFTLQGDLGPVWGRPGVVIEDFFGCCNPIHIALLPDGRFVTAEKGIPRIKIYDAAGKFQSVVAGPRQLDVVDHELGDPRASDHDFIVDLAVDSQGRVLVLEADPPQVRIFQPIE